MNISNSFRSQDIFKSIYEREGVPISKKAKASLVKLEHLSEKLYVDLDKNQIDKEEIIVDICSIASYWRDLIREDNSAIGSDCSRLKLYYAFENILDNVKSVVNQKMNEETPPPLPSGIEEKTNEGGWYSFMRNITTMGASTTLVSSQFFNQSIGPESSLKKNQEQVEGLKNQFFSFSSTFLYPKSVSETSYQDILNGISDWEAYLKESFDKDETNIRIAQLKRKVIEQINESATSSTGPTSDNREVLEISAFLTEAKKLRKSFKSRSNDEELQAIDFFQDFSHNLSTNDEDQSVIDTLFEYERSIQHTLRFIEDQADTFMIKILVSTFDQIETVKNYGELAAWAVLGQAGWLTKFVVEKGCKEYDDLLNKKNQMINEALIPFTPAAVLADRGNPSFNVFVVDLMSTKFPYFEKMKFQNADNLSNNISSLLLEKNIIEMSAVGIKAFINVMIALENSQGKTDESILEILRETDKRNPIGNPFFEFESKSTTLDKYKKAVESKIIKRLTLLFLDFSLNEKRLKNQQASFFQQGKKILSSFKERIFTWNTPPTTPIDERSDNSDTESLSDIPHWV